MKSEQKPDGKRIVLSLCADCSRETNHDVICEHHEGGDEHYSCDAEYAVVKCRGCGRSSFRYVFSDYEQGYPVDDDGNWDYPTTIENYPKSIKSNQDIGSSWHIPEIVREIHEETLKAIREGASILAGLGLRGTIEAICNNQGITGKNLEVRISKMASQGLISQKDAKRLNAIRFLGNDAAHEIRKPNAAQIGVALKIVEHMMLTIYILDEETRQSLDYIIDDYDDFEVILSKKLNNFSAGNEFPLAKFLEKDVRRLANGLSSFESELILRIASSKFQKLTLGKVDSYNNSQASLQHFIVV